MDKQEFEKEEPTRITLAIGLSAALFAAAYLSQYYYDSIGKSTGLLYGLTVAIPIVCATFLVLYLLLISTKYKTTNRNILIHDTLEVPNALPYFFFDTGIEFTLYYPFYISVVFTSNKINEFFRIDGLLGWLTLLAVAALFYTLLDLLNYKITGKRIGHKKSRHLHK